MRAFPSLFPDGVVSFLGARATWGDVGTVAVLVGTVVLLQLFFLRTRLGLALRTAADNPSSARLLGLPVGSLLLVGWGLAALLGGLAGCLVAPSVPLQPNMMDTILVYALAAAVLGGLDSPLGAVVAAWLIGIVETVAGANIDVIGSDLRIAVPLVLLALILLVRPAGPVRPAGRGAAVTTDRARPGRAGRAVGPGPAAALGRVRASWPWCCWRSRSSPARTRTCSSP